MRGSSLVFILYSVSVCGKERERVDKQWAGVFKSVLQSIDFSIDFCCIFIALYKDWMFLLGFRLMFGKILKFTQDFLLDFGSEETLWAFFKTSDRLNNESVIKALGGCSVDECLECRQEMRNSITWKFIIIICDLWITWIITLSLAGISFFLFKFVHIYFRFQH